LNTLSLTPSFLKKNILNQLKSFGSLMLPKAHDKILYSPATSPAGEATRLLAEAGPWLGFGCFVGAQRLKDFRAEVWPWAMGHGGPWAMGCWMIPIHRLKR
jgi:hypothetical protein